MLLFFIIPTLLQPTKIQKKLDAAKKNLCSHTHFGAPHEFVADGGEEVL